MKALQSDLKMEIEIKNKEIDLLFELSPTRHKNKVKWIMKEFHKKFKPSIIGFLSYHYAVAGYRFQLIYYTDDQKCHLNFRPTLTSDKSLEWPFKALFITRVICHKNIKYSLIIRSPMIVISRSEYNLQNIYFDKQISSIPLSTDLTDYIQKDC